AQLDEGRVLVVSADFPHAPAATAGTRARRLTFGLTTGEFRASDIRIGPDGARFAITREGAVLARDLYLLVGGRMNVANALGVWVLLKEFGLSDRELADGLASFSGVARRQEIVGEAG